jgi:hypothetical protein
MRRLLSPAVGPRAAALALAVSLAAAACGDDPPAASPDAGINDETDSGPSGEGDAAAEDTSAASCEHPCLDEQGRNDRRLCPAPAADWTCTDGCCVALFKCQSDDDCRTEGYALGQCADDRFDCRCDLPTGLCGTWYCGVDSDCGDGTFCVGGTCQPAGDAPLAYRVHGPTSLTLLTGYSQTVRVDGTRTRPDGVVVEPVEATWASADPTIATVDGAGRITAVAAGETTVTGRAGETTVATVSVTVRGVDPSDSLTVLLRSTSASTPLSGVWALVDAAGTVVFSGPIPADGLLRHGAPLAGPVDLHVLPAEHDWVSWAGLTSGAVLDLPLAPAAFGRVELDASGAIVAESTQLSHVGLVRGTPDFSAYRTEGAFEIVLTSTRLGAALFDFSLPALLGADVRRYLDPDHNIPRVSAADPLSAPGGIVFNLAGPAIPDFTLTAPEGKPGIWTLGGRLDINEIAEYSGTIVDALSGGDLDFTQIVGAIFPLFRNFWSAYSADVVVDGVGDPARVTTYNPKLLTPMAITTQMVIPPLPRIGDLGWADALFLLGGALTPDGAMVPLGLNGGADTADKGENPPDGRADADAGTPGIDPYPLPMAPLHSGLSGPHSRFVTVTVAVSIPGGGDPRPSAGSVVLTRLAPGERPPAETTVAPFLGFPEAASYDPETRTVRWGAVAGADLQRVLFKGKRGRHWTVYGAKNGRVTLPVPADLGVEEDRAALEGVETVLINSLDFARDEDAAGVGTKTGPSFDLLLALVDRVSFLDVKNTRPPAAR